MTTKKYDLEGLDSEGFVSIRWHVIDVHDTFEGLTDEEAADVLVAVRENHDANNGVTWDTLFYTAQSMFPEKYKKYNDV